jgi:hypothetical protein
MFGKTFKTIGSWHREILSDDKGKLNLARVMLYYGWLFLTAFVWKLIITHTLTIDYFVVYAGFVSGHSLVSKYIDTKGNQITAVSGQDPPSA